MSNPRHLWSGAWREDSERARREAEEAAARQRAAAASASPDAQSETEEISPGDLAGGIPHAGDGATTRGTPRRRPRKGVIAIVAIAFLGLLSGVFAAGTLIGGGEDGPAALPAVANTPIKPKQGQTQAGAIYAAASQAVVSIRTGTGSGTGFVIDDHG